MTTPIRFYSSTALETNLTASITNSATSIQVASTTGFPASTPFTLALDYGAANEELVDVTAVAGLNLTVTRGVDFTSASSHNAGAIVRHVASARDHREAKAHEAAVTNVHGFTPGDGEFVGTTKTQTLSNKTLVRADGSLENIDIFNVGTWVTSVIGDSANPSVTRFAIKDDEISLLSQAEFRSNGALFLYNPTAEPDNNFRLRITNIALTDDRFYLLAGGTMNLKPTTTTPFPVIDLVAADTSTTKRAIRVAAAGGGTERFTVWNDGRVDIVGTATNFSTLDVTAPAGVTADMMRVMDSTGTTMVSVQNAGKLLANRAATITQPGILSGAVLQVGGLNVGYTGNLTQWVRPDNTIIGTVNQAGDAVFQTVNAAAGAHQTVTTGATAATGFSVGFFEYKKSAGVNSIILEVTRTGADIDPVATGGDVGNVTPDLEYATIPSGTRPPRSIYTSVSSGIGHGTVRFQADGSVQLLTWIPTAKLTNGSTLRTTVQWIS